MFWQVVSKKRILLSFNIKYFFFFVNLDPAPVPATFASFPETAIFHDKNLTGNMTNFYPDKCISKDVITVILGSAATSTLDERWAGESSATFIWREVTIPDRRSSWPKCSLRDIRTKGRGPVGSEISELDIHQGLRCGYVGRRRDNVGWRMLRKARCLAGKWVVQVISKWFYHSIKIDLHKSTRSPFSASKRGDVIAIVMHNALYANMQYANLPL